MEDDLSWKLVAEPVYQPATPETPKWAVCEEERPKFGQTYYTRRDDFPLYDTKPEALAAIDAYPALKAGRAS